MATGGASKPTNTCQLAPGQEFRLEVPPGETASLTLVSGSAEVFGAEMVANRAYTFGSTQQAVFSWGGCSLEVQGGEGGHSYVASETPMMEYLKLHTMLDQRRTAARASGGEGPRVLICGPSDTGKSSLCRILANYLARSGHEGTIVDFDLEHGEHLVPGAVCAVPIARPLDIEGSTEDLAPLAYWLGHASSSDHVPHLKHLVSSLSRGVRQRHEANEAARAGGMVLNTSGWVEGAGFDLLKQIATELRADVLVVIGEDRLHSQLISFAASAPGYQPSVYKLPKSGGVVSRSAGTKGVVQSLRINEYLYGAQRDLFPHSLTLEFDKVNVFAIGVAAMAPSSALPIGMRMAENQLASKQLPPSLYPSLSHSLLAVLYAESEKCDDLLAANAAGFVWVSAIDTERQKLTLLAPSPLVTPTLTLLAGSIKWSQVDNNK